MPCIYDIMFIVKKIKERLSQLENVYNSEDFQKIVTVRKFER